MTRRRFAGATLLVAVLIAATVPLALHARANGPSQASLPDFANSPPVQQSAPSPWAFEVRTGGLQGGDQVSFRFLYNGQVGDRAHSVNFVDLDPTTDELHGSVTITTMVAPPTALPIQPVQSQQCVSTPGAISHPSLVQVDPYGQSITVTIQDTESAGNVLVYCFKPTLLGLVGFPTSTTPNDPSSGYSIAYSEPGGSIAVPYFVTGQAANSPSSPVLHVLDTAGSDVTDRGLGGSRPLVYGATYGVILHGQTATNYSVNGTAYGAASNIATSDDVVIRGTGAALGTCTPGRGQFCTDAANGDATGTLTVTSSRPDADYVSISALVNSAFTSTSAAVATIISVTVAPAGSGPPTPGSVATPTPVQPGPSQTRPPFDPNCATSLNQARGIGSRDVLDALEQVLIPDATVACAQLSGNLSYSGINDGVGLSNGLALYGGYGFAGLDRSLTSSEYSTYASPVGGHSSGGIDQFPVLIEPIVVTYNLGDSSGCQVSRVNLRNQVLGLIFMGKITTWNNQLITQDNNGLQGCNLPILVAHDTGIASSVFKDYLSKGNSQYTPYKQPQLSDSWPSTSPVSCTANGSRAMALCVAGQPGMIGYGYYRFITQAALPVAGVDNATGTSGAASTSPSPTTPGVGFQASPLDPSDGCTVAAGNSPNVPPTTSTDWSNASITNPPMGYPICAFDFVVANATCTGTVASHAGLRAFLGAVYLGSTQDDLVAHGFAPLPQNVVTIAQQGFNPTPTPNPNQQRMEC